MKPSAEGLKVGNLPTEDFQHVSYSPTLSRVHRAIPKLPKNTLHTCNKYRQLALVVLSLASSLMEVFRGNREGRSLLLFSFQGTVSTHSLTSFTFKLLIPISCRRVPISLSQTFLIIVLSKVPTYSRCLSPLLRSRTFRIEIICIKIKQIRT